MRDLAILFVHLIVKFTRLLPRGGHRAIVAEPPFHKPQLAILNRSREHVPNLVPMGHVIAGLRAAFMRPTRLMRSTIALSPATVLGVSSGAGSTQVPTTVHAQAGAASRALETVATKPASLSAARWGYRLPPLGNVITYIRLV